jgi:ornithine cyclodeaminase
MITPDVEIIDAGAIVARLSAAAAAAAVTAALRSGLDPGADPARAILDVPAGQLLSMPSSSARAVGVKVAAVAPGNPGRGLPRINAVYLLFDAETLRLRAILDGTALTTLRTPAVSVAAVTPALDRFENPPAIVVFGAGPQAIGHVAALRASALPGLARVTYVVRNPARVPADLDGPVVPAASPEVADRLADAGVVVCATTSGIPLFDADSVRDGTVLMAVGSHEATVRELPGPLLGRADVIVEDVATALREAGDVVLAIGEGQLAAAELIPIAEIARGKRSLDAKRTVVFKGSGMAWEDLVVAEAVLGSAVSP